MKFSALNQPTPITNQAVQTVFTNYPEQVKGKLLYLRELILETASELDLTDVEETLKWGEPSYLSKHGSTLRIDWKEKSPEQYAMYFKCTSKLVTTFQLVFGDLFEYEKTRAIVFKMDDEVPKNELKQCIQAALTYHKVKQKPFLGISETSR